MIPGLASSMVRLFAFQGSWNYDRLQGIGMAVTIEPLLQNVAGGRGGDGYRAALRRAVHYFNTNPYFAGLAVGAVARAEADGLDGAQIERLRAALKGPLGALGDRMTWTGILPIASAIGLVLTVTTTPFIGAVVFLALFNAVTLSFRLASIPVGWRLGRFVGQALVHPGFRVVGQVFDIGSKVALGFAIPLVVRYLGTRLVPGQWLVVAAIWAMAVVALRWIAPTFGSARFALVILVLVAIMEWIWM